MTTGRAHTQASDGGGPTHQTVVLSVLAQLGGSERFVDIEEVTLGAYRIAPSRFSWRTRPDLPSTENVRWALVHAKARDVGLVVQSTDGQSWKLTADGVAFVRKHADDLARANLPPANIGKETGRASERVGQIRRHPLYRDHQQGTPIVDRQRHEIADLLITPPDAPKTLVMRRLDAARAAAEVVHDLDVLRFLDEVAKEVERKWS